MRQGGTRLSYILYFPIAHNALCLPPKFCMNYCFGNMQSSQENLKTMVYAKFGGQTKCIMGNWKIVNRTWVRSSSGIKSWGPEKINLHFSAEKCRNHSPRPFANCR